LRRIRNTCECHDHSNRERPVIERGDLAALLMNAGFVAASDEAIELLEAANGDEVVLTSLVERRLRGEPIAWIVGYATFCGLRVNVHEGVYVPRWQSEPLARRAAERLPAHGVAIDVCTGSGAIAMVLHAQRPSARVLATELDERAVVCARSNSVDVFWGDLFAPLPRELQGQVDVVVGVVPYVPSKYLDVMPRDTFVFESPVSYDGGIEGVDVLRRVLNESRRFLRPSGALLLEIGGEQAEVLDDELAALGFGDVTVLLDDDGDLRGLEATLNA
jgi:release factor glutamine methyltransferase